VPLRAVVAAVGVAGLVALVCSNLLGTAVATLAAVALLAGSYASYALLGAEAAARRKTLSISALLVVAGYAAFATFGGGPDPADGLFTVGPLLAALLVGIQVAHSVVLNARRDLMVGLLIGLFMTVLAAGLSPGLAVAVPLLLSWPAAVTATVLAHRLVAADGADAVAVLHRTAPGTATRPVRTQTASRVGAVVAVCVVIGLTVFLVLPQPQGISARSHLLGGAAPDPAGGSATASRSTSYYTSGYMDLRARGALGSDPVLEVPADSPQLWRSSTLDMYDGTGWQSSRSGGRALSGGPDYAVPLATEDIVPDGTVPRTDTVVLLSGDTGAVVAPGPVTAVHADSGHLIQLGTGLALFDWAGPLASYSVTSLPEVLDPQRLRDSTADDLRDRHWTQLPATLPLRVRQLAAQVTAQARTRYDAVEAVERYLRDNETYRLDSPVPALGQDAVDDFLFVSRQGFCEQFASAAVVLLRAEGIPARLVTGFGYGQPAPNGRRVMLTSDAHAWVEVWYPGLGWSSSDPTAGAAPAVAGPTSVIDRITAQVQSVAASAGGRALLAVGLLALGLVGAGTVRLWLWLRRSRAARAAQAGTAPPGPVLAAFLRLDAAMGPAGSAGRPAETLAEYAYRLPSPARPAVQVLERECYGPTPPDDRLALEAARIFDRLAGELLAAPTSPTDARVLGSGRAP
jgi:transglutaminase-like putative cysteine protease